MKKIDIGPTLEHLVYLKTVKLVGDI